VLTALYLSPHLDDVMLSCAGGVRARVAAGTRVVVCSIFTRTRNRTIEQRRAAEDFMACALAGAERLDLGFDDAPDREHIAPSFTSLMLSPDPPAALVRSVRAAIAAQVRTLRPDEIWFPLAIGGHRDHRAVFAARTAAGDLPTRFYADRPYAFVPAFVALCRAELAGGRPLHLTAAALARQIRDGACDAFIDDAERADVLAELVRRLAHPPSGAVTLRARRIHYPRATLDAALALVAAYRSQTRALFGTTSLAAIWRRHATTPRTWYERAYTITASRRA
jgi:LmbE family N-acetylglucosaminyl deacetylase